MQRYEIIGKLANVRGVSHTGRYEPHKQIEKRRRKYPHPNHILSYSETTPKERECSNGKVRRTKNEQRTNKERTKNEQRTNKRRTKDEQKTNKRRTNNDDKAELKKG
ncbi:hypothetical protein [Capnocytophaga ochracea]|uniref:hypothetical protein n=1 Tax=Capnocytophaga ochracea TaxID=1018 RepID=UPI0015F0485A|nr:hypothetical protein [Capnocytophaga ochracea]